MDKGRAKRFGGRKMIDQAITELVQYGLDTGLVAPEDKIFVTNQILEALGLESYEETPGSRGAEELEQILKEITDYAVEKELIADSIVYRDLFDTKIMGKLVPLPSMVSHKFYELYQEGPKKATDYFYKLSQDSDYIRRYRIKKDQKWITETPYGEMEITINLSKPEKDPKAIAAAKNATQSGYPKCQLCKENEGYAGRVNHPARQDPTPILIANAYAFGARNYDPKPIFKIMRKGAEEPGSKSQDVETRPGLKQYLDKGYYNASIQLEYTSADFAIGQFALHAVGDEFARWRYFHFARSWKNLYNSDTGWLQSRNPDGSWKSLGEDFRESTYKNYFWMVPYDIAGLVEIIGGKEKAEKRLDEFFTRLDAGYNDAWFASGNEPSFHIPWIYNWIGRPYKTQEIINRVLNEQYSSKIDGLPGNDDLGTMGAWYVFACIGLYPEIPGVGGFTVNTPIFSSVKVHLKKGDIVIKGGSEKDIYIKSMKLNGKSYESTWIDWDQLNSGATIEYRTSGKPDMKWGAKVVPPSFP